MRKSISIIILLTSMAAFWCFAESFLIPEKPERRRSIVHIKQEIVELMGVLIEQKSSAIEREAKIQQLLCKHMRAYAEGDKKGLLGRAKPSELQRLLRALREEKKQHDNEQAARVALLSALQAM